jgi:hypothetical protein
MRFNMRRLYAAVRPSWLLQPQRRPPRLRTSGLRPSLAAVQSGHHYGQLKHQPTLPPPPPIVVPSAPPSSIQSLRRVPHRYSHPCDASSSATSGSFGPVADQVPVVITVETPAPLLSRSAG